MHVLVVRSRLRGLAITVPIIFLVLRFFPDLALSMPSSVLFFSFTARVVVFGSLSGFISTSISSSHLPLSIFFFSVRLVVFIFVRRARFAIVRVFMGMNADLNHGLDDCDPIVFPHVLFGSSASYIPRPFGF